MTDNENNLNTFHAAPFPERYAAETFYAGAGRGEVLHRMTAALEQGVALLILTGDAGSGKTTICRQLEREASRFCFTVFLTKSVESFEDVVKKMAMWLGLSMDGGYEGKHVDRILDSITAHLKRESVGLLVIFDEAENIYLATLERIRKMLDRVTQAGARMHIVFSGSTLFLNNYAQLSICDFKNSHQLEFELPPLSEEETGEYLHAYALDMEDPDKRRVFNDEIVRNIFSLSKGNFRKINLLAEESLRTHGDDTSFMVLLENVKEETGVKRKRRRQAKPHFLKRTAHYLPWLGGVGCIVLLVFYLMKPEGGDRNEEKVAEVVEVAEVQKAPEEKQVEDGQDAITSVAVAESSAAPAEPTQSTKEDNVAEQNPLESLDDGPVDRANADGPVEEKPLPKEQPGIAAEKGPAERKVVSQDKPPAVVQIGLDRPVKIRKSLASDKGSSGNNKQSTADNVQNQPSVDQLLQKRVAAGSTWTRKGKEALYTMQLMALTDKNAEGNLKKMLAQPQYRQESKNFYIFKKTPNNSVVFVFYGEYPTLAKAREAQENLPPFLRIHQPYAISIKGAMAKVKK